MGIRFRCHHCEHELNLKNFQAGRRGRCPVCSGRFRVPTTNCDFSTPLEDDEQELTSSALRGAETAAGQESPTFELKQPTGDLERFKRPASDSTHLEVKRAEALQLSPRAEPKPSPTKGPDVSKKAATKKGASQATAAQAAAVAAAEQEAAQASATQPLAVVTAPASSTAAVQTLGSAPRGDSSADAAQPAPRTPGVPLAIAEAPQAVWYVRPPSGGQFGPADSATFYQWMKENRVAREALVWRDGWPQWMIAGEAFEEYYGSRWLTAEPAAATIEPSGSAPGIAETGTRAADVSSGIALAGDAGSAVETLPIASPEAASPTDALTGTAAAAANPSVVRPLSRRKRRRTNYALWISVLALVAFALVAVLITVLMSQ